MNQAEEVLQTVAAFQQELNEELRKLLGETITVRWWAGGYRPVIRLDVVVPPPTDMGVEASFSISMEHDPQHIRKNALAMAKAIKDMYDNG